MWLPQESEELTVLLLEVNIKCNQCSKIEQMNEPIHKKFKTKQTYTTIYPKKVKSTSHNFIEHDKVVFCSLDVETEWVQHGTIHPLLKLSV